MNELLSWLLDLDALRLGGENVRFAFERPYPAWLWPGLLIGSLLFALWSYSRLIGRRSGRIALATIRGLLLFALFVLIAGPQLVQSEERIEEDWILVLVDRSASMTIEDAPADTARQQRERQLEQALDASWPTWRRLAEERTVVWLGFDAGAYDLGVSETQAEAPTLDEPTGRRTALGAALDQALRRAAARPLAGVVILSDGRSIDEPQRTAVRRLQAERVPVHVVPLGSEEPAGDLAIRRVEGPSMAFVDDLAPVTVELDRLGAAADLGGTIRLIDKRTGLVLDERIIEPGDESDTITLTHRPQDPGEAVWSVVVEPSGVDLIPGNNTAEIPIELVDRPLRALYVDGYPRWEQRYLRNLLIREGSIESANLLLAPNRRPSQEGDFEIDALPNSPEEWAEYDVVILGDVHPDVFTRDQLENLREHVAIRGGGLLWIGGAGATPSDWWGTSLADLLPFTRNAVAAPPPAVRALVAPTELARQAGVLRLGPTAEEPWPDELATPDTGWSMLRWIQPILPEGLKPTAEVLAFAVPPSVAGSADPIGAGATPLILAMRYGAGRTLYVATDEIWRWRYARGEILFERFWLQLIRMLGRESLARSGRLASLSVSPRQALVEQPVRVAVELFDQSLVELDLPAITVRLTRKPAPGEESGPDAGPSESIELELRPETSDARTFVATWLPTRPGDWTIRTVDAALAGIGLEGEATVSFPDDELRRPETNHPLLADLASRTGGRVMEASELGGIENELPNRRVRLVTERAEPLWDAPLTLIAIITLLTVEWVGRRLLRLI